MKITFHLNPHTILPILCMILAIMCGAFVITQNPKAKLNQIFLTICITFAVWFSFYIPPNFNYNEQLLVTWFRVSYCFISFIPIMCFTFITSYLKAPRNKFWFKINMSIGLVLSILSITTNLIIKGVSYFPWHPYPHAGIAHPLLIIHCLYLACFSIKLTTKALNNPDLSSKERNHIKYMLSAIISLTFATLDFIGNYNITFYEIGYIPTSAYLVITTIAIVRHQLMDIHVAIKKSLVYSTLVTVITFIFITSVLIFEYLFHNYIGYKDFAGSILTAFFITLIFIPLKNKIQHIVDKIFFKGTPLEIAEQNDQLRQEIIQTEKLKSIAILASGMGHEIKNPLTVLKTFSEYLPQKLDDKEFLKKFSYIVSQEVTRIDNLVHELLDFARPANPVLKPVNIHHLINSTLDPLNNENIKHNIKINRDYQLPLDTFLPLDYNQIKQALLNIFLNAIDAMKNGGQLNVSTFSFQDNRTIRIKIQDTGIGISPQDLPHIFDPFFSNKDNGTGLGLSITHEIIKKHGGKILVESVLHKGSIFILEFSL